MVIFSNGTLHSCRAKLKFTLRRWYIAAKTVLWVCMSPQQIPDTPPYSSKWFKSLHITFSPVHKMATKLSCCACCHWGDVAIILLFGYVAKQVGDIP